MPKKYTLNQWSIETAQAADTAFQIPVEINSNIDFEFRSASGIVVEFVDNDGQVYFYDSGNIVAFNGVLDGAIGIAVTCSGSFTYRCNQAGSQWKSKYDPVKHTVVQKQTPQDAMQAAIRQEMAKMQNNATIRRLMNDDAEFQELMEDYIAGDTDFDEDDYTEDDTEHGKGFMEDDRPAGPPPKQTKRSSGDQPDTVNSSDNSDESGETPKPGSNTPSE